MSFFARRHRQTLSTRGGEIDDAVLTVTEKEAARLEWPLRRKILSFFFWVSAAGLLVIAGRVLYLNVYQGTAYQEAAERNSLRRLVLPAPRGIIYDRFGKPLVRNVPSMDVVGVPADLPKDAQQRALVRELVRSTFTLDDMVLDELFASSYRSPLDAVLLKDRATEEETLLFLSRSREMPGIRLYQTAHREYEDSLIFSHIIGYEGKIRKEELSERPEYLMTDPIGRAGLEKQYETVLRGGHGFQLIEVNALGQAQQERGSVAPRAGNDLITSIDADLQKKIFESLQVHLQERGLQRAAAAALDPRNGEVLAVVNVPSYDNNVFARGITSEEYATLVSDESHPLFSRAVSGEYPPGSTIKPIIAAAALAEGVVDERTQIESRGGISVGKFFFGDWKAHGFTDIERAIAVSSDVYFYSVGGGYGNVSGLGMERMKRYETLFGLGGKTGIDLPGEASGFLPDPRWKEERFGERWYVGDDYHAAIGQGYVTATPLQIVNAIAAIANGGTLYEPHIASQIRSVNGNITAVPTRSLRDNFINPDILRIVQSGMRKTVTEGTAQALKTLPVAVAGKTGTAQFGSEGKTHGWFVSFAPYDDPRIAMVVLVEGQGEEGYNAVPVTQEVYEWYFSRAESEE